MKARRDMLRTIFKLNQGFQYSLIIRESCLSLINFSFIPGTGFLSPSELIRHFIVCRRAKTRCVHVGRRSVGQGDKELGKMNDWKYYMKGSLIGTQI